jgi:hypothetical protein
LPSVFGREGRSGIPVPELGVRESSDSITIEAELPGVEEKDVTVTLANGLRRGAFESVPESIAAVEDYLAKHNADPKPFVWTKPAQVILAKNARACAKLQAIKSGNQALESEHSDVPSQALRSCVVDAGPCEGSPAMASPPPLHECWLARYGRRARPSGYGQPSNAHRG